MRRGRIKTVLPLTIDASRRPTGPDAKQGIEGTHSKSVSYTHLTLPTILLV